MTSLTIPGSALGGDCVVIAPGSYGALSVPNSGTSDSLPIRILVGGPVTVTGINISNRNYVTVDGEGPDAATQYLTVNGSGINVQGAIDPVVRYVNVNGGGIAAQYGSGGDFDHLYVHNIGAGDDCAVCFAARDNGVTQYDKTILENSHIVVNSDTTGSGNGSDGVQGCPGCTVRYSYLENNPGTDFDTPSTRT